MRQSLAWAASPLALEELPMPRADPLPTWMRLARSDARQCNHLVALVVLRAKRQAASFHLVTRARVLSKPLLTGAPLEPPPPSAPATHFLCRDCGQTAASAKLMRIHMAK